MKILEYNTDNLDIDIIIANPPYNFPNKSNAIWPLFLTNSFILFPITDIWLLLYRLFG